MLNYLFKNHIAYRVIFNIKHQLQESIDTPTR